jgi:hypothetical protein
MKVLVVGNGFKETLIAFGMLFNKPAMIDWENG